jgi:outer membrane protein assembly factor BamB
MIFPISEVGGILYAGRDPFMGEIPQNAKAYAFRVSDGAEFWSFSPDNSLDPRGAAIVEGRIVFRGDAGIFALDARTGELIWNVEFGINPPFVVEKNIVYATYVHRVIAVDSQDGRWLWSVSGDYEILADPLFALNSVHVGTRDGAVFTLDGISGEELWSTRLDSYISELVASNTTVYAVTSEGIYALRNGRQL